MYVLGLWASWVILKILTACGLSLRCIRGINEGNQISVGAVAALEEEAFCIRGPVSNELLQIGLICKVKQTSPQTKKEDEMVGLLCQPCMQ